MYVAVGIVFRIYVVLESELSHVQDDNHVITILYQICTLREYHEINDIFNFFSVISGRFLRLFELVLYVQVSD